MVKANKRVNPYPFTAIVGQEDMKLGLILNMVDSGIGGILAFGEKGTAKSTAIRALASLLPEIEVVKSCSYNCDPYDEESLCKDCKDKLKEDGSLESYIRPIAVVDLPVSATEDRVVGTLDIEEAIQKGFKKFEAGILAEANRGILYVDEVNLLDDHIVDLLLDAAAMGINTVEREGVSYSHAAKFILVGTMNPEEGELRPQLLDRFGFSVKIEGIKNQEDRLKIIKYRNEYDKDPAAFVESFASKEKELKERIVKAKELIKEIEIEDEILLAIAKLSVALEVDGHRADITLMKAARANAAFDNRTRVEIEDVKKMASFVYRHRMRSLPFEQAKDLDEAIINKILMSEG